MPKVLTSAPIVLFLILVSLAGCAPRAPLPPVAGTLLSPPEVIERLSRKETLHDTLSATANVLISTPREKYSRKIALLLQRPSLLRIDAIPIFGSPDFFLSIVESSLKVFLPQEGHFYIGTATAANLFQFFRLSLPADAAISILMGIPPSIQAANPHIEGKMEGDLYRIDVSLPAGGRLQSLWVEPTGYDLVRLEIYDGKDSPSCSALFSNHNHQTDGYPRKVKIYIAEPYKTEVSMRYSDIVISPQTEEKVFDLPLPAGITPEYIY